MKALVLELEDGRIAALREDGEIVTADQAWPVGEYIDLPEEVSPVTDKAVKLPVKKRRWAQAAMAASLAFVLLTGSYTYTTALACSYVSVETEDASVELAVNRLGKVIEVKALNGESEELAETLTAELRHRPVEEALEQTVERFREEGRLTEDETVFAGITDKNEQRAADLTEKLERAVGRRNELHTVEVSPEEREEARDRDMGGGRFVWEQRAPDPQPENIPAPGMAKERAEPPRSDETSEEATVERPRQDEEQAAPAKPDGASEPPFTPDAPGRSEQAAGVTPEQIPEPPQQGSESAPDVPEERQELQPSTPQQPEQQVEPPVGGSPVPQTPDDHGFGGGQFGEQRGMSPPPGGNEPMNGPQPGGVGR